MKWNRTISLIVAGAGAIATNFLGGADKILKVLILLMILDYLLGVMCGYKEKKLSSEIGFYGILKKITILIIIAVAVAVDININAQGAIRSMAIYFYASMEGVSILENAVIMGVPVPEKLREALLQLKEGNKKEVLTKIEGDNLD